MNKILAVLPLAALVVLTGCASGPVPVAENGAKSYKDGAKYEGQLLNGVPEGKGTMVFADGGKYEGAFKKGVMEGKGVYHYADGISKYDGDFKDGKRHGNGVLTRPFNETVIKLTGTFVNDKPRGKAVQEAVGMFTIECEVKEDSLAYGQGKRTYVNGDTYVGEFRKNHHYKGVYTWANGDKYEGTFGGHLPNGEGVKVFADGGSYKGDFVRGTMHGKGVYKFPDGSRYEGEFNDGKMEGRGIFISRDGTRTEGTFKNDEMVEVLQK